MNPDSLIVQLIPVRIMQEVSLTRHRHTAAGSLSGGQQRLLALALELLNDRRILFLDEPTSGLDSTASLELVTILRRLSRKVKHAVPATGRSDQLRSDWIRLYQIRLDHIILDQTRSGQVRSDPIKSDDIISYQIRSDQTISYQNRSDPTRTDRIIFHPFAMIYRYFGGRTVPLPRKPIAPQYIDCV